MSLHILLTLTTVALLPQVQSKIRKIYQEGKQLIMGINPQYAELQTVVQELKTEVGTVANDIQERLDRLEANLTRQLGEVDPNLTETINDIREATRTLQTVTDNAPVEETEDTEMSEDDANDENDFALGDDLDADESEANETEVV